jgi:predicted methyltransferase
MLKISLGLIIVGMLAGSPIAFGENLPANTAATASDAARADQAAVDARRHGPEILSFAGVRTGDKVVDLVPGGGYWTRLFARSVGPSGHVFGVWPIEYEKENPEVAATYKATFHTYANVTVLEQPANTFAVPASVDLVFTSQNYHDYPDKFMGSEDPAILNAQVFAALRRGGIYLIIDHAAPAGSGMADTETLHRIDPAIVKTQVEKAGFLFVGESTLLRNPADDHSKFVFDKSIIGRTDQFIYKFRKP